MFAFKSIRSMLAGVAASMLLAGATLVAAPAQPAAATCGSFGFFCTGELGGGSVPTGTKRPVIVSPSWEGGVLYMNIPNSFIQNGARVEVNRSGMIAQTWSMSLNFAGTRMMAAGTALSRESGISLATAIPRGVPVQLVVINPDGLVSDPVTFVR